MIKPEADVIVVGAGWAGLSCAYELTKAGAKVYVLEATPQAGGRARAIKFSGKIVDNGQHLFAGAYHSIQNILSELQTVHVDQSDKKQDAFERYGFGLRMLHPIHPLHLKNSGYNTSRLQLVFSVLFTSTLTLTDKYKALLFVYRLLKIKVLNFTDISVLEFLHNKQQSPYLIKMLWEPLALAALSTPIHQASAAVFITVLQDSLQQTKDFFLLAREDLSQCLPKKIINFMHQHNNSILYHQRVKSLLFEKQTFRGVHTQKEIRVAQKIVLATPPDVSAALLSPHSLFQQYIILLKKFSFQKITTIYFNYAEPVNLGSPFIGITEGTCHWIFDRAFANQPNILAVVITGNLPTENKDTLIQLVLKDIIRYYPLLNSPLAHKIISEQKAAFSCEVNIDQYKLPHKIHDSVYLCGDYMYPFYPATLESAVRSGIICAKALLD